MLLVSLRLWLAKKKEIIYIIRICIIIYRSCRNYE